MGQTIQIWDTNVVADVLLVSTDRSLTGQDGESYTSGQPIGPGAIFPAQLAARLFESDPSIDHVYVMSNVLSIRRSKAWDESSIASARDVVASFFLFYESQESTEKEPAPEAESNVSAEAPASESPLPENPSPEDGSPSDPESPSPAETPLQNEADTDSTPSDQP